MSKNQDLPDKETLERMRMKAELEHTRRPYYKKTEFYASISPIILGIAGLLFSWWSGFFEMQHKQLDIRKNELQNAIEAIKKDSSEKEQALREREADLEEQYRLKLQQLEMKFKTESDSLQKIQEESRKISDKIFKQASKSAQHRITELSKKNQELDSQLTVQKMEANALSNILNYTLRQEKTTFSTKKIAEKYKHDEKFINALRKKYKLYAGS